MEGETEEETKKEENRVAGEERGGKGRGRGREGQKGKLVHAMIMVMNHKSHNIAEENKNQHSQTKREINNNPSHKKHKMLLFPRCVQSIHITMAATGYGTGDDKTAPAPTQMDWRVRRRPASIQALAAVKACPLHPEAGPFRLDRSERTDNHHS